MCGMTGWVDFSRDLTREQAAIEAMTETMACRGPDATGTWIRRDVALGHRRLAVIDLVGGAQPMVVSTPSGDVAMVYTGEAYNYTELRRELVAKGHSFETSSDTEVVLRGYLQWGEALADRLNGMYAFAIWDSRERKLVMIRDRMGVKPFSFYPIPDGVLFGSEPKAVFANPMARRAVDLEGLRELIGPVTASRTAVWKGMREVQPGTIVTVDERGIRERTYWRLESRLHIDDRDTTVANVRGLLDDIVRRQLVADVPECVLLSGGLDSSRDHRAVRPRVEHAGTFVCRRFHRPRPEFHPQRHVPHARRPLRARGRRTRRHRPHRYRARSPAGVRSRCPAQGDRSPRTPDGRPRTGSINVLAIQSHPTAVDGGAVRGGRRRDLRRVPAIS